MMPRLLVALVLLLLSRSLYSQQEASMWYFGLRAGLDFRNGSPTILLNGAMNTMEGVATISDANGNLLFYTNGQEVYNRQHSTMPNGTGLYGHFSSSQSAIMVPKINDPQRYYLFTVDAIGGPNGFNYSVINMALDGGKGDVEIKNIPLASFICEKVTAVKHCNGTDIWVLVHRFNSAEILAYLVTASGVNPVPVVSSNGIFVPSTVTNYSVGCMKASPDGSKLAIAHFDYSVEVMGFDNLTGSVSGGGPLLLPPYSDGNPIGAYGVEFSPNSKYLYLAGDYRGTPFANFVLQYNVTLPDIATIRASKYIVFWKPFNGGFTNFGTLQIGPDGKIYMAEVGVYDLSVIDHPNQQGVACGFNYRSLNLQRLSTFGLPSFIQSNFRGNFTSRGICSGDPIYFDYDRSLKELSIKWDFGDTASGSNNFATQDSSQHIYNTPGVYTVRLIRFTACDSDTITKTVNISSPQFSLGADSLLCGINNFIIAPQISGSNNSLTWQDNSTSATFTATQTGMYWLEVIDNNNGCKNRDSVYLTFRPIPTFSLGSDLDKCEGEVVDLSVNVSSPASYSWSNGYTTNSIQVSQSGEYWLEVNSGGCKWRDTVSINFHAYPGVDLGKDTTLCEGNTLVLDALNGGMQYLWENSNTTAIHNVTTSGLYWVSVSNFGCARRDSILVNFLDKPGFILNDTTICSGMTVTLTPNIFKGKDLALLWSNGSSDKSITISQPGNYSLTITNQCADIIKDITVSRGRCELFVPSAFTPNGDGLNDIFKALYGENVVEFSLQVYDRWGELVFSSKDKSKGWNGRYKGQLQNNGIYVWIIRYKAITDITEKMIKGTVMLIR